MKPSESGGGENLRICAQYTSHSAVDFVNVSELLDVPLSTRLKSTEPLNEATHAEKDADTTVLRVFWYSVEVVISLNENESLHALHTDTCAPSGSAYRRSGVSFPLYKVRLYTASRNPGSIVPRACGLPNRMS